MALPAEKVGVGFRMTVEAIGAVRRDFNNLAQFSQKRKIAVYGSQADIRKFLAYMQIDGIGSRMVVSGQQKPLDRFPLTAVF